MGKLVLVPTPIGNLEDITLRALRTLREADVILAEDTRTTGILLKHFEISKKQYSYHQHNEHQLVAKLIPIIEANNLIALCSDAGSPGISDPGFLLVRECIKAGIEVESLPGPTALIPALTVSGFPTDKFVYEGFLPLKKGRETRFKRLAEEDRTIVLYESPHRVVKTLTQMMPFFGEERLISVSREITKKFEQTVRGTILEVLAHFTKNEPKGEFVMVIHGKDKE